MFHVNSLYIALLMASSSISSREEAGPAQIGWKNVVGGRTGWPPPRDGDGACNRTNPHGLHV